MDTLVSTQWLADEIGMPNLVVVDASSHLPAAGRDAEAEFRSAHIPGARFLDLKGLVDQKSPVPAALPRPDQLASRLAELGITPESRIVFYDDSAVKTAARAWYLCRAHGLEQVAILDGGLGKWRAEGRALESGSHATIPAPAFTLSAPQSIKFKSDMLANIESGSRQVLDARDAGRFSGAIEDTVHNLPSGHIPGSRNLPFASLFAEDGTFKREDELRELFQNAGIALDQPVTATCGSGVTACVLLFALDRIGHRDTALYDGSWLDWGSDPSMPVEMGDAQ